MLCVLAAGVCAAPAAHANSAAAEYFRTRADRSAVPSLLSEDDRAYYRQLFAAIHGHDWRTVQALFALRPDGPLHSVARAEYFIAPGSPRIDADSLSQWLAAGATLPEAEQVEALASKRGLSALPLLPAEQALIALPAAPRRTLPRDVPDPALSGTVTAAILDHVKRDDPAGAKLLLDGIDANLAPEARAEWRQRIAWSFYIENDDSDAYAEAIAAAQPGWWQMAGALR